VQVAESQSGSYGLARSIGQIVLVLDIRDSASRGVVDGVVEWSSMVRSSRPVAAYWKRHDRHDLTAADQGI
jgi:hypothetical protein